MRLLIALCTIACTATLQAASPGDLVFSEIMWMGSTASSADEWLELYNRSDVEIDLTGWTITRLTTDGEQVMLHLEQGKIAPGAVFLIANYTLENSRSRLATAPHLVLPALTLPNSKLQLRLYDDLPDQGGRLIDIADDGTGNPLAGDSKLKRAMVRIAFAQEGTSPTSWATAQEASGWDPGATELGTPGQIPAYLQPAPPAQGTSIHSTSWGTLKDPIQ